MVQRKSVQGMESYNLQREAKFVQQEHHHHLKILGPEMMMMKRTKPKRMVKDKPSSQSKPQPPQEHQHHHLKILGSEMMKSTTPKKMVKDTTSPQPGKPQQLPLKHDLVVGSPNYMKGTSSSEARKETKKRFSLSRIHKNQERSNNKKPSSRVVRGLTKAPSFKRCAQRATCSSTLKDSKFPNHLMLNHGETDDDNEVSGTSVLKVCPYTYCSLNGHHHSTLQNPPLKSFIASKRRSLKSHKSMKREAPKEECEDGNRGVYIDTQTSETLSDGAPRSETDSDDNSNIEEMVKEVDDFMEESQETCEVETIMKEEVDMVTQDGKEILEKGNREEDADDNASDEEEALKDKAEECKQESQERIEVVSMLMIQDTTKFPYNKGKKPTLETEDSKEFNPREPNYLPVVADEEGEKVDLKHQDMDDRKNSEDWMIDYALQRAVTKLSSARKRKVALLVEAFETVQPVMPHGSREPAPVLSYGGHLQACN